MRLQVIFVTLVIYLFTAVISKDNANQDTKLAGILYLFAQSLLIYLFWTRHVPRNLLLLHMIGWKITLYGKLNIPSSTNRINEQFLILVSILAIALFCYIWNPNQSNRSLWSIIETVDVEEEDDDDPIPFMLDVFDLSDDDQEEGQPHLIPLPAGWLDALIEPGEILRQG